MDADTREPEPTLLRCESCGTLVSHLHGVRITVRSLSLGREIRAGEMICARCMQELQEEQTEEEMTRGPA